MNYGLNNNTGLGSSQANNGLQTLKRGIVNAGKKYGEHLKSGGGINPIRDIQDGLKAKDSVSRIKSIAQIAAMMCGGG